MANRRNGLQLELSAQEGAETITSPGATGVLCVRLKQKRRDPKVARFEATGGPRRRCARATSGCSKPTAVSGSASVDWRDGQRWGRIDEGGARRARLTAEGLPRVPVQAIVAPYLHIHGS